MPVLGGERLAPRGRLDGRSLTRGTKAAVRRLAVESVLGGARPSAVMRRFGLCRTTIYRWLRAVRAEGRSGIAARPHPGRPPALAPEDAARLRAALVGRNPEDHGLAGRLWTRRAVGDLVRRRFGPTLSLPSVGRLLHRLGIDRRRFSPCLGEALGTPCAMLLATDRRGAFLCELVRGSQGSGEVRRAVGRLRERAGPDADVGFRPVPDPDDGDEEAGGGTSQPSGGL
jgi:transposase